MDYHGFDDTIAAVATPPGHSGIGIVRVSGPDALRIADELFVPASPRKTPSRLPSFTTAYGRIVDGGRTVDEVILTVMRAPRTYTTQDVVEINCHGGMVPLRRTLELVLAAGVRLADPGEFTKRAFFFGRIDLAQAEAVADIITARTDEAQRAAVSQLEGRLSAEVNRLRDALVDILAHLEAALDFGDDEQMHFITPGEVVTRCRAVCAELDALVASALVGRALREGVRTAIVGRPNVGKSSLMNALLGHDRVIVTPVPGTTRDVVEDAVNVDGVPLLLADTAGMRTTHDVVEAAGVARSQAALDAADLVLLVIDGAAPLEAADIELMAAVPQTKTVLVVNKSDLPPALEAGALDRWAERPRVAVSAKHGAGVDDLKALIARTVWGGRVGRTDGVLVTNVRHKLALARAREATEAAAAAAEGGLSEEFSAADLREALDALGEIVGITLTQDVINHIFERFCIGK